MTPPALPLTALPVAPPPSETADPPAQPGLMQACRAVEQAGTRQPLLAVGALMALIITGSSLRRILRTPDLFALPSWPQLAYWGFTLAALGLIATLPTLRWLRVHRAVLVAYAIGLWVAAGVVTRQSMNPLWGLPALTMALQLLLDGPDGRRPGSGPGDWPWGAITGAIAAPLLGWLSVQNQTATDVFAGRVVLGALVVVGALGVLLHELGRSQTLLRTMPAQRHEPAAQPWRDQLAAHLQRLDHYQALQLVVPAAILVLAGNLFSLLYQDSRIITLNILLVRISFSLCIVAVLMRRRVSARMGLLFALICLLTLTISAWARGDLALGLWVAAAVLLMPLLRARWRWPMVAALLLGLGCGWVWHRYDPVQAGLFGLSVLMCGYLSLRLAGLRDHVREVLTRLHTEHPAADAPPPPEATGPGASPATLLANRWGWITFGVTLLATQLALGAMAHSQWNLLHTQARMVANEKALLIRNLLDDVSQAAVALGMAITGETQALPQTSQQFERLAGQLLQDFHGVSTLQYAPNGVIRWSSPLAGNEGVIGHNLLAPETLNAGTATAMRTGQVVLIGPQTLRQGGWGVIGRYPVYRQPGNAGTFMGLANAVMRLPEGLAPAQLDDLARNGLHYQLWRIRPDNGQPQLILPQSDEALWPPDEAETVEVRLHNIQWFVSVRPAQGFGLNRQWMFWSQLGLLLSVALALYVRQSLLLRQAAQERDEMRQQMHQLALERRLHEVQRAQERVDDLLPLGLYRLHFSPEGEVVADHLSPAVYTLFGLDRSTPAADLGAGFDQMLATELPPLRAALLHACAHHSPLYWRGSLQTRDGPLRWLESRGVPHQIGGPSGAGTQGYVGYLLDITEQVNADARIATTLQQAQAARAEAEQANAAKSMFLATMSHEMRTPLNAIIGLGDLLALGPLDAEQRTHLTELQRASRMLLGIINDVLDLAKIEAGEFELSQERFNLGQLVDDVSRMMQVSASTKGLALTIPALAPELLGQDFLGDPLRLRQILLNLMSNAIKFTRQGQVRLTVQALPTPGPERERLGFEVSDTGIGIPADLLPLLFRPFVQADSGNTRRFGGTGLGLSVVRELAERMGGHVQVSSQPGQGSTFRVEIELTRLPGQTRIGAASPTPAEADGRLRLEGVRLLLVDDSDMNLEVAGQLLRREGAEVDTCSDGQQALDWLDAHGAQIDVVLMDVQMPVMDGNTAVGHLRRDPRFARLPVIALTAGAMYSEREKSLQAGMSDYLTKPFERGQMVRLIRQHVQDYRGQPLPEGRLRPTEYAGSAWPQIDGIALPQVQQRLNGNLDLFHRLLQRLLDEFGDLARPAALPEDGEQRRTLEQRLHKLAGNAGLLGANTVFQLAKAAETAMRAQALASVPGHLEQLAAEIARLQDAATPVLAQARARAAAAQACDAAAPPQPLEAQALDGLRAELQAQKFSAMAHYQQLAPALRQALSSSDFASLENAMNTLNFRAALALLQSL